MSEIKILKITQKGKKYLVYSSEDEKPIKLTEDVIVNNRIIKGAIFDEPLWEQIKSGKDFANLFDKTLSYIDFKPRTEYEIRKYLSKKETTQPMIEDIIARLKDIRYIDDEKYTQAYIEEGIKNKKGPQLIMHSLEELGVSKEIINKYLINYDYSLQVSNALDIATKYQVQQLKYPAKKQKELIYQKLARSGFYLDTINKVLSSLSYQEDSLDKLEEEYLKILSKTNDKNKIITSLMTKGYCYEDIKKVIKDR